ncbi:MAG: DUF6758 family protein [Marmoricola sp.]
MPLLLSCPRCARDVKVSSKAKRGSHLGTVECPVHGIQTPLARPHAVDIEGLREVSELLPERSIYLPWPMSPGWAIADFGCVAGTDSATFSVTIGSTVPDGRVEVSVISEDPGVGVGARCAGLAGVDPGRHLGVDVGGERPAAYVRIDSGAVAWWIMLSLVAVADLLETTAFAGEADGRWLWVVIRPASAALLMRDDWLLTDISGISEDALGMPFGTERASW